jgi:hypothetical protein
MKAEPARRGRQRWRDKNKGRNVGATMKGAAAPQGRQRLCDKEGSGGATTKAEPAAQRGRERRRDDEGSGGATISSGAMMTATAAQRRRQNRRCNDEGRTITTNWYATRCTFLFETYKLLPINLYIPNCIPTRLQNIPYRYYQFVNYKLYVFVRNIQVNTYQLTVNILYLGR